MQNIIPWLWFDGNAEEAVETYLSVFRNSRILSVECFGEAHGDRAGSVSTVTFELDGLELVALNAAAAPAFSAAVSLCAAAETQEEIDRLWDALLANGGTPGRCGWLRDRFGVSWQVAPTHLAELLAASPGAQRELETMGKIVLDRLG